MNRAVVILISNKINARCGSNVGVEWMRGRCRISRKRNVSPIKWIRDQPWNWV